MDMIVQQTEGTANPARFNAPFKETSGANPARFHSPFQKASGANLIKLPLHVHSYYSWHPVADIAYGIGVAIHFA